MNIQMKGGMSQQTNERRNERMRALLTSIARVIMPRMMLGIADICKDELGLELA